MLNMSSVAVMMDHALTVSEPVLEWDGAWWVSVQGATTRRHGPFPSSHAAWMATEALFRRWGLRARHLGGWAWRRTHREWVVTLPRGVPCAGRPFCPEPVSRHTRG